MQKDKSKSNNTNVVANEGAVRCAIYADVPTEGPNSVAEQIRTCTEYALKRGLKVAQQFVQSDIRVSGVSFTGSRPCYDFSKRLRTSLAPSIVFWSLTCPAWVRASIE